MDEILYRRAWGSAVLSASASAVPVTDLGVWSGALTDASATLSQWSRPGMTSSMVWVSPPLQPVAAPALVAPDPRQPSQPGATGINQSAATSSLGAPSVAHPARARRYSEADAKAYFVRGLAELADAGPKPLFPCADSVSFASVSEISFEMLPATSSIEEERALLGPRAGEDTPAAFLARLAPRPGSVSLWPCSNGAFVEQMAQVHRNMCLSYASRPVSSTHAGVAPQFFRDLPRQHTYVYGAIPEARQRPAFDLRPTVQLALRIAMPLQAKEDTLLPVIAPWLDRLCPENEGLLRHDVTSEATQAALAIPLLVLRAHQPAGCLVSLTGQLSPEFVLWRDTPTSRVHVVAVSQFTERYALDEHGVESISRPRVPYCLWAHFSIGRREAVTAPMDLVFHGGNAI